MVAEAIKIKKMNDNQIYRETGYRFGCKNAVYLYRLSITGCMGSCHMREFKASRLTTLEPGNATEETGFPKTIRLAFVLMTTRHEIREQYAAYDFNAFIADVGGFLGLLLGHSIYSLVSSMLEWSKGNKMTS